jgi:hypothetical protein
MLKEAQIIMFKPIAAALILLQVYLRIIQQVKPLNFEEPQTVTVQLALSN